MRKIEKLVKLFKNYLVSMLAGFQHAHLTKVVIMKYLELVDERKIEKVEMKSIQKIFLTCNFKPRENT